MRMNISVPDALAEEVRERNIPISAVCQRALRDEVRRLRVIQEANDILIYDARAHQGIDAASWPGFDPAKPRLVYGHHPVHGFGWTLHYAQDDPRRDIPGGYFIPGAESSPPLRQAREHLRGPREDTGTISVEVGEPALTISFRGRWLVEPDAHLTRTADEDYDAGMYWGVALTGRGRIAVYTAHANDSRPAALQDFDRLSQAAAHLPADILAQAVGGLGGDVTICRDI